MYPSIRFYVDTGLAGQTSRHGLAVLKISQEVQTMTFGNMHRLAAAGLIGLASSAHAVDVTVNSTQPEVAGTNYQSINAALSYVASQAAPRTVRITGGGPYEENMAINFSVTVKGDGYRPIIAAPQTAGLQHSSLNGNGVSIYTNAESGGPITVRLENFILIPSTTNGPTGSSGRAIRANNNNQAGNLTADEMNIELVDLLITSNNGLNAPVTQDGLSQADLSGATVFGDDGIHITGNTNLTMTGTIVSNIYGSANSNDGIVFFPDGPGYTLTLGPGCVISYMNRMGIQVTTDGSIVRLNGSAENPIVLKGNYSSTYATKNPALMMFQSKAGNSDYDVQLSYVVFQSNNATGLGASASDIPKLTADHVAFDSNQEAAIITTNTRNEPWTFTNSTFVNNGLRTTGSAYPQVMLIAENTVGASSGALTFTDCVIAGNGAAGNSGNGANLIHVAAPNVLVSFVNCGIPTGGSHAVGTGIFKLANSAPTPTQTSVINADPHLQSVNGIIDADYLTVQSAAYGNAGSGGSDLSGYGAFTGTVSSVSDWSLYY